MKSGKAQSALDFLQDKAKDIPPEEFAITIDTAKYAIELAEADARERVVRAIRGFILQNLADEDDVYMIDKYMESFLRHYDNE